MNYYQLVIMKCSTKWRNAISLAL